MREVIFSEHRGQVGAAKTPQRAEVARFKDENATARVVTASQSYVVYSLKSRSALRVLPRQAAKQASQLSYKKHTADVTSAEFVNMRSNVVASTSANEMLVWYIDDDGQIHTYFTLQRHVVAFAWVPVTGSPPDLLVIVKEGETKTAALLKSSNLIVKATKLGDGTVGTPDGSLVATNDDLVVLRKDITAESCVASASSPIIAYSATPNAVVTASLANKSAPTWEPCDGAEVKALAVLPNELLIAVSAEAIHIWEVAGEPRALQRIVLGSRRSTALHCTSSRATVFVTTGKPNSCEAVVLGMQAKVGAVSSAIYDVDCNVTPVSSCVVPGKTEDPRLHVDTGSVLQVLLLQDAAVNPIDAGAVPSEASPSAQPPAAMRPQLSGLSGGAAPELDGLKMHIETALGNTASMLNVSRNVVAKDHSTLVQEALKAQAKALAALAPTQSRRAGVAGGDNAFDAVIEGITDPVATALVEGISAAIEDELRSQLDTALRSVLARHEKRKQKDQIGELRSALDGVVTDLMGTVQQTIRDKQVAYASRLIHYVSDVASEGANAVQQLQQIIVQQQQQLAALSQSGLLDEVKRLRAEVAQLKARAPQQAAAAAAANMPPETILANAKQQLESGNHVTGLDWVLQFDDAALTVQLLVSCDETLRNDILEDAQVKDATWTRLIGALVSTPKIETLEPTLEWLCDIISEKKDLMRNDQLAVAVSSFMASWKSNTSRISSSSKELLRRLMLLTRR